MNYFIVTIIYVGSRGIHKLRCSYKLVFSKLNSQIINIL
jgi:hypothetical protein